MVAGAVVTGTGDPQDPPPTPMQGPPGLAVTAAALEAGSTVEDPPEAPPVAEPPADEPEMPSIGTPSATGLSAVTSTIFPVAASVAIEAPENV